MAYSFAADASKYLTQPYADTQTLNPETNEFSAAMWCRVSGIGFASTACGRMSDDGGGDDRWSFHFEVGTSKYLQFWILKATLVGDAAVSTTDFSAADPDDWYHVVGVCTASGGAGSGNLRIYVNGTLEHDKAITSYPHDGVGPADFFIGRTAGAGGRPWDGDVAEVAFWKNYVLSQDEITAMWRGVNPMRMPRVPNNYFPLWGLGDPAIDLAGTFHLDVVGSPTVLDVHAPVGPPFAPDLAQYPGTE